MAVVSAAAVIVARGLRMGFFLSVGGNSTLALSTIPASVGRKRREPHRNTTSRNHTGSIVPMTGGWTGGFGGFAREWPFGGPGCPAWDEASDTGPAPARRVSHHPP